LAAKISAPGPGGATGDCTEIGVALGVGDPVNDEAAAGDVAGVAEGDDADGIAEADGAVDANAVGGVDTPAMIAAAKTTRADAELTAAIAADARRRPCTPPPSPRINSGPRPSSMLNRLETRSPGHLAPTRGGPFP
jgi:hypothetical protein